MEKKHTTNAGRQPLPRYIKAHTRTDKESTALQLTVEDCFDCGLFQMFRCLCEGLSKHTRTNLQQKESAAAQDLDCPHFHTNQRWSAGKKSWKRNKVRHGYLKRPSSEKHLFSRTFLF
ncbi:hypothetical protein FQA47_020062 [Oryzias melastigma]|uniref:Uncharacterized protein n=1 Tax=Oryzias melastigma TaxID=30732 RepID=A0A834FGW7_ORYME|nr:hypothetical protein FQA47_020062 [Oryzias melastigma]